MEEPSVDRIDVVFVGQTGVGKSSLINMIMSVPGGLVTEAKVTNDARPCTTQTTPYLTSPETGLRCKLWDTRGLDEAVGGQSKRMFAKMVEKIRSLASQQARELKEALRDRTKQAKPILVWCIDATKIDVPAHWQPLEKVYVEYCERKAIPVVVITQWPPRATGWETNCKGQLEKLNLGVQVPIIMVRKYRNPSDSGYMEDSKALQTFISDLITRSR